MNNNSDDKNVSSPGGMDSQKETKERLIRAEKDFKKIMKEVQPFIRKRKFEEHSTAGEWCDTSNLCF